MVQLSLEELKSVLNLLKEKKRRKKNKGKKRKRPTSDGYYLGGQKSDSSHMQGYSQAMPFSNTSNQQTEIQHLQRNLLENQIKHPDRFDKPEVPNNLLTMDNFNNSMRLFGSQLANHYDNRIGLLENKANQFASDLNYGKSDFIRNRENAAYIEQLPDDDEEEGIKPINFKYDDGIDVAETSGSDFFRNAGNDQAYEEDDPVVRSPMHTPSLSDMKANRPPPETPYFETTDVYSNKTPSVYFNKSEKGEPQQEIQEEKQSTPRTPKGIIKKITKYFSPINEKETVPAPTEPPASNQSKISTGTRQSISIANMENYDTDWYKSNINDVIAIEQSDGYPKGNPGDERFRQLFFNLGVPLQEIDNYIARSKYSQRKDLYKAVYAKVRANNNKIIKKQSKQK